MREPITISAFDEDELVRERVQMWLRGQLDSDLLEEFIRGET